MREWLHIKKLGSAHALLPPDILMKIMMAEDDLSLLQLAGAILRELGHKTVQALDASQVLSTAQREKPDLILLDINMPGGKGTDLLVRLKRSSLTAGIPVIVIISTQDVGTRSLVAQEGAQGFLPKPWNPETFAEDLRKMAPFLPW